MLKKRPAIFIGIFLCTFVSLFLADVSLAEETVKSAKDLIMELASPPPAEKIYTQEAAPARRTRGLVPRPTTSVTPVQELSPRQENSTAATPFVPRQGVIKYSRNPPAPAVPDQEFNRRPDNPPVQAVQTPMTGAANLSAVQFVYDSDELLPVAKRQLDQLVIALQDDRLKYVRIQLIGHTDAAGSREYNRVLSIRRAESAARYLIQAHRIPAYRIIPVGMGEDRLLDPYNPLSAVNRRVEIVTIAEGAL